MKTILAINSKRTVTNRVKVEKKLLWYDHKKKKMITLFGGKLSFENQYDSEIDEYRMVPVVDEVFEKKTKTVVDHERVDNWFDLFSNYNNTFVLKAGRTENGIIFNVPEEELKDFTSNLDRENIEWEDYE